MNVPIPDPSKNEGSSLVLAILVGVAAIVVISLMIRTTSVDEKKGREEVQRDAIAETMDVFNKFESGMESSTREAEIDKAQGKSDAPAKKKAGRPMDLTPPPTSKVNQGEEGGPQASIFFDGFGSNGDESIFAKNVDSTYGALDVITGFNLSEKDEAPLNEPAMPVITKGDGVLAPLNAEQIVPESLVPEAMMPPPKLPEVDPRSMSGVESAMPRLIEYTADSELDVALREAVAVREGFSASADVSFINRLSPPLFSHPAGSFPLKQFDIELKLANPNPKRLSQIRYSIGGPEWFVYEGTPIIVAPGTKVSAYCESMDRTWGDSPRERRDFLEQTVSLEPPTIYASALEFDEKANQRISIAITNPNRYAASRVEYRFGGSPWQVYRESVKIDGAVYSRSGVRVEARVVGVIGVAGRQASDSVAIEFPSSEKKSESVAVEVASRSDSIIELRNVDLGAPEGPHGYRARSSAQTDLTSMNSSDDAERFLLETFEAYRRTREKPEVGISDPFLGGGQWGRLGVLIPDGGDSTARSFLAERNGGESVLDGNAISLFESAVVERPAVQ